MAKSIKMNAWLLTWTVTSITKIDVDPIAAILSSRKSESKIVEAVELLYLRSMYGAYEMAYYANRHNEMPFRAQRHPRTPDYITCGGNPCWLVARRVTQLRIQVDEENEKEILSWKEPPSYKFNNFEIEEIIEGEERHAERRWFSPLGKDTWREPRAPT